MYCCFCGHSDIVVDEKLMDSIHSSIKNLISIGVTTFFNGGYGNFDIACLKTIGELNKTFPHIKSYIVLAYRDNRHIEKYNYICKQYNAETIYTLEPSVLPKFAISKRNEWMVDNSDYILSFVNYTFGGAFNTLQYAKRKRLTIVSLS